MGRERMRQVRLAREDTGGITARRQTQDGERPGHRMLHLQQQAGNRATNSLVQQVQQRESGGANGAVRRFPSTALSQPAIPVNWVEETAKVKKSSEGASGGVFFLTSKSNTEPKTIVVKPNYGVNANNSVEEAGQLVFGDRAISSLFGVNAPTSRVVQRGTPEFEQLVQVCTSADVAPTTEEEKQFWHPVSDANAMIVMGAVPNATSLSSLAKEAWDDPNANQRLSDAVFSPTFLHDMGKLVIADLLIGNDDRIHAMAMNVGNMMLSSMNGDHKLYAIDSRAVLGQFKPDDVLSGGSGSSTMGGTGSGTTKRTLDKPRGDYLDNFYESLKRWIQRGAKDKAPTPENGLDPGDVLWDTYQGRKDQCVQAFSAGWDEGLAIVRDLVSTKEGRGRMKDVVGSVENDPGKEQVRYTTLKINAMYLGARAGNKTHEDAAPRTANYAAVKWLKTFDPDSVRIPRDEFFWDVARPPKGDVLGADVAELADRLPHPSEMKVRGSDYGILNVALMNKLGTDMAAIKTEFDGIGTKTKGVLSKREVSRNRVVLGKWLADVYLLGAGSRRAIDHVRQMDDAARYLEQALAGPLSTADAQALMMPAMMIRQYHKTLTRHLESYLASINEIIATLPKVKRYANRGHMATALGDLRKDGNRALDLHARSPRMQNPQVYEHALSGVLRG